MRIFIALCIALSAMPANAAKLARADRACTARCAQEMRACYRINDVIHVDHCDREHEQCLLACVHGNSAEPR